MHIVHPPDFTVCEESNLSLYKTILNIIAICFYVKRNTETRTLQIFHFT